ncbi:MAG: hypothetical protein KJZ80_19800 [Hyphomicrobiaceae bacterium]|nr:hypothetical protein [Hyphomicrobiaceae bacterium]
MITIQAVMLVALGFLLAILLALALAPAYRARAVRLTYRNLRRIMPLTDGEIRADKDRLKAQYAVRIHDLETKLEKARLTAARQQVEVNRRDASVSALEAELAQIRSDLEQNVNARRVLEQTIMDRLPAVEQRLADTSSLLEQRDRDLAALMSDTGKSVRALDEVMQINAQQRAEIERLNAVVATRAARNRGDSRDARFDGEVALRSELQALRARTRDQESLISRLQSLVAGPAASAQLSRANGAGKAHGEDAELERLRRDLADAEATLKSISDETEAGQAVDDALREKLQPLDATIAEQAATIRRLEASLAAYQQGETGGRSISLKDSKIAMKARIAALQADVEDRTATIEKLRAEVASVNERLAIQTARFVDEMRRLGAGTPPMAGQGRRPASGSARRTLAERIGEARPALAASMKPVPLRNADRRPTAAEDERSRPGGADVVAGSSHQASSPPNGPAKPGPEGREDAASGPAGEAAETALPAGNGQTRPSLLDRIASLAKS